MRALRGLSSLWLVVSLRLRISCSSVEITRLAKIAQREARSFGWSGLSCLFGRSRCLSQKTKQTKTTKETSGSSFRPEEPPTHRPNDCANRIGQPILPARLAEWNKELMRFIRHPIQRCRDNGEEKRTRRHLAAHTPTENPVAEPAKDGILHPMQDFVADYFEQERWQLLFRVRLGRQVKNRTGIQHHRHPVPEHLNHHTWPSCVTH